MCESYQSQTLATADHCRMSNTKRDVKNDSKLCSFVRIKQTLQGFVITETAVDINRIIIYNQLRSCYNLFQFEEILGIKGLLRLLVIGVRIVPQNTISCF